MDLDTDHPMGPLGLGDLVGLDVCLATRNTLYTETAWTFENRIRKSERQLPKLQRWSVRATGWITVGVQAHPGYWIKNGMGSFSRQKMLSMYFPIRDPFFRPFLRAYRAGKTIYEF